jgi:hypothetical protein
VGTALAASSESLDVNAEWLKQTPNRLANRPVSDQRDPPVGERRLPPRKPSARASGKNEAIKLAE